MIQSVDREEISGCERVQPFISDSVDDRQHLLVDHQAVQGQADETAVGSGKVRQRLCFLNARLIDDIHALTGSLHQAAKSQNLCNAAVARDLTIQDVFQRNTIGKSSGALYQQPIRILTDEHASRQLIVPMTDSVQNSFSDHALIKGRDVKNEEPFLIMLYVIPQVDKFP